MLRYEFAPLPLASCVLLSLSLEASASSPFERVVDRIRVGVASTSSTCKRLSFVARSRLLASDNPIATSLSPKASTALKEAWTLSVAALLSNNAHARAMQLLDTRQPTAVDVVAGLHAQAVIDFLKLSLLYISLANPLAMYDATLLSCASSEKEAGSIKALK